MSCLATPLRLLPVSRHELHLASTLPSGQSFRWHRLSPPHATLPDRATAPQGASKATAIEETAEEWAFGWQDRTVVLRQDGQFRRPVVFTCQLDQLADPRNSRR